jgi:hypothetical protein
VVIDEVVSVNAVSVESVPHAQVCALLVLSMLWWWSRRAGPKARSRLPTNPKSSRRSPERRCPSIGRCPRSCRCSSPPCCRTDRPGTARRCRYRRCCCRHMWRPPPAPARPSSRCPCTRPQLSRRPQRARPTAAPPRGRVRGLAADRAASATGDGVTALQRVEDIGAAKPRIHGPVCLQADANRALGSTQRITTRPAAYGRRDREAHQAAAAGRPGSTRAGKGDAPRAGPHARPGLPVTIP